MEDGKALYVFRGNQRYGPYSQSQVRSWLASGEVLPTDLACYEGSTEWLQVYGLSGMQVPLPSQPLPVPASSGWGLMIPGLVLVVLGGLLSATILGAIIGIPMFIAGFIMTIYGRIKYNRRVMADLKESVRVGVVQGMLPHAHPVSYSPGSAAIAVSSEVPTSARSAAEALAGQEPSAN